MTPGTDVVQDELSETHWAAESASNANTMTGNTGAPTQIDKLTQVYIDENSDGEKESKLKGGRQKKSNHTKY